jgi:repressor LexA
MVFLVKDLTQKQRAILSFIEGSSEERGFPPSFREIAAQFETSLATAQQHVDALKRKGWIARSGRGGRALTVTGHDSKPSSVEPSRIPLVASIAAGLPIAVEEVRDSYVDFTPDWFGRGSLVAVNVIGDSMSGDAIADGDIAIIRLQCEARPTEIAAVRIDRSEVTLKRVKVRGGTAELIPSNPDHRVREVAADQIEVVGVLAGILRRNGSS